MPDPSTLAGNVLWLRAKDVAGSSGSSVTSWADQSGQVNDARGAITGTTVVTGVTPSGGRVVRVAGGQLPIPNLGLAVGSVIHVASSQFNPAATTFNPGNLYDGNASTEWVASTNALPQWVRYKIVAGATVVTQYTLRATSSQTTQAPAAWTLEGSQDAVSWTTLDTQTGQALSSASATTYTFSNSTGYVYYRLNVSARNGGSNELRMAEWTLVGVSNTAATAGPGEMWLVVKSASASGVQAWKFGTSGSSSHYGFTGGVVYDDFGATVRDNFTPTVSISSAFRIFHVAIDSSGNKIWELDNVSQLTQSGRTKSWVVSPLLSVAWSGDLAEVLIRNQVSTSGEIADLITYFNTEHGLTVAGGATQAPAPRPRLANRAALVRASSW